MQYQAVSFVVASERRARRPARATSDEIGPPYLPKVHLVSVPSDTCMKYIGRPHSNPKTAQTADFREVIREKPLAVTGQKCGLMLFSFYFHLGGLAWWQQQSLEINHK